MYEEIEALFSTNLERVTNLLELYERTKGQGRGRRSVKTTDVLRAAVVLLHASLEDALRELMKERMPNAAKEILDEVPLSVSSKGRRPDNIFLGALLEHKGKLVDQLIKDSIDEYYGQISFNDPTDIVTKLRKVKIEYKDDGLSYLASLKDMILRRHSIVHEADRNPNKGHGRYYAQGINLRTLRKWIETVRAFIAKILELARTSIVDTSSPISAYS